MHTITMYNIIRVRSKKLENRTIPVNYNYKRSLYLVFTNLSYKCLHQISNSIC